MALRDAALSKNNKFLYIQKKKKILFRKRVLNIEIFLCIPRSQLEITRL